jgi:hypothetical protein
VRHRLSKSRFTAGQQCHRQLWWKAHEPRAEELRADAGLQAIFDMGHRVGARAQQEFANATLIELDYRNTQLAVEATRSAIAADAPVILEASFIEDDIFVAVDALSKEDEGWVLTEVKATSGVKAQHIPDAAVQAHVVERAGLPVTRVELMHLNNQHRHPNEGALFTRADITDEVAELRADIPKHANAQLRMLDGELPNVPPGAHCTSPYVCPFHARCNEPPPDHAIEELHGIREKKLGALRDEGIETIHQVPSDFPLNDLQKRQREAVVRNETIIEPGLQPALAAYPYPIAMLDFETVGPALPVWDGCKPFGKVPVQFSVHTLSEAGDVSHHAYLADGKGDPRPQVAKALASALDGAATVLAWNATFEKQCLSILAESSPEHAAALLDARNNTKDLLPVVRSHFYHPAFHGSFSIKSVVPALLPDMSYDDLDVSDGQTASTLLERWLCRPEELKPEERTGLQERLVAYCNHDTAVMVALFEALSALPQAAPPPAQ